MRLPLRAKLPAHPRTPSTVRRLVTEWLQHSDVEDALTAERDPSSAVDGHIGSF